MGDDASFFWTTRAALAHRPDGGAIVSGGLSSYCTGEVLAPIGGETLPG
jgi:hypothetical protein